MAEKSNNLSKELLDSLLPIKEGEERHHRTTHDLPLEGSYLQKALTRMKKRNKKPRYSRDESEYRRQGEEDPEN
jgi:hypothetical protein